MSSRKEGDGGVLKYHAEECRLYSVSTGQTDPSVEEAVDWHRDLLVGCCESNGTQTRAWLWKQKRSQK